MTGFLGCLGFLECLGLLSASGVNSGQIGSLAPGGGSTLTYAALDVTRLPCTCFQSLWTPKRGRGPWILCSWGIVNTRVWMGWQGMMDRPSVCPSSPQGPTGPHLKSSKITLLRILGWWHRNFKPRTWPMKPGCMFMKLALVFTPIFLELAWS